MRPLALLTAIMWLRRAGYPVHSCTGWDGAAKMVATALKVGASRLGGQRYIESLDFATLKPLAVLPKRPPKMKPRVRANHPPPIGNKVALGKPDKAILDARYLSDICEEYIARRGLTVVEAGEAKDIEITKMVPRKHGSPSRRKLLHRGSLRR